jgi:membrane-associated phospholipid phosphatase
MGLLGGSQMASNPVAAMPSLHAAGAALLLFFCWRRAPWWARCLLVLYPLAMGLTLVYTGEHYVVDVVAGWLAAGLAVGGWRVLQRLRPSTTTSPDRPVRCPGAGCVSATASVGSRQEPAAASRERRGAPLPDSEPSAAGSRRAHDP